MTHPTARTLHAIAALFIAANILAFAQQPPNTQQPTLKLTTRLTQVDITATDASGHPIHGLTQSDFTIQEDGKPQPIKNFEEFSPGKPSPTEPPPQLPPNTYTNAQPQSPITGTVNVLLIDDVTTGLPAVMAPENVMVARSQAIKYVQTMPAGTQVVILELTDRVQLVQNITTDRDVLLAALKSIIPKQSSRTALPPHEAVSSGEICAVWNTQSTIVIAALEGASAFLSGIKGRKNLIWFTPGIPWLTDYENYQDVLCLRDYTASLQRDYNLLTAAQVALYPVDPKGVVVNGGRAPNPSGHFSMEDLASSTGGRAFYNNNDIATEIGQAIANGTDYYSLSYVPPIAKYDGQYHKINVSVDRPGVQLTYRKGYTSIDPAKTPQPTQKASGKNPPPADSALYTAMAHGAPPATQILFTVAVTPSATLAIPGGPIAGQLNPKLKTKTLTRYDFNYILSPAQITVTDGANGQHLGAIEFTAAAYSGDGQLLNVLRQTASFTLTPSQFASFYQHKLPMHLQLDLPPGPLFLRAAIRDLPSNKLGTLEIPLTVPDNSPHRH